MHVPDEGARMRACEMMTAVVDDEARPACEEGSATSRIAQKHRRD
jgi:hypothetical protein